MKNIFLISTLLFILSTAVHAQTPIGNPIYGESSGDSLGEDLSFSSDGNILAVRGRINGSNGCVHVYENNGGDWGLLGVDETGGHFDGITMSGISLSKDGSTLAMGGSGIARVFTYVSGVWTQVGTDIPNSTSVFTFGSQVTLSADGKIIAVSAPSYVPSNISLMIPPPQNYGLVQVFQYQSGNWNQIGGDIVGILSDQSGEDLSISSDGNIIAISTRTSFRVYENIANDWIQKGSEIFGQEKQGPTRVSLSADGNIVAGGFPNFHDNESEIQAGLVSVHQFLNNDWIQIGSDIVGDIAQNYTGRSVSLSATGEILVVGESVGTDRPGRVRFFENQGGEWIQIGISIEGEANFDELGTSSSIAQNGQVIAVGAPGNDFNISGAGKVTIYNINELLSSNSFDIHSFKMFPNPTSGILEVILPNGLELKQINIYNPLGQIILSGYTTKMDLSMLSSGSYLTEVITDKVKFTKTIIVN